MRYRSLLALPVATALLVLVLVATALAQTATTGAIVGSVTDKTGAIVGGADVELTSAATNQTTKVQSNADGQYVFPSVLPGNYKLLVTKAGFRKASVNDLKIDVSNSYTINLTLEVGEVQQTVEITASAGVELQTTDSTVGNVI